MTWGDVLLLIFNLLILEDIVRKQWEASHRNGKKSFDINMAFGFVCPCDVCNLLLISHVSYITFG